MSDAPETPEAPVAPAAPQGVDTRRREAMRKLGRTAIYTIPLSVSLMTINRAVAVS